MEPKRTLGVAPIHSQAALLEAVAGALCEGKKKAR